MWPLVFAHIQQAVCPQQAQTAGQSSVNSSGATRSLVPRGLFHQKPRARKVMTFHLSRSQRSQPLLPVTGSSPHCVPSFVVGWRGCNHTAKGTRNGSTPQIAHAGHGGIFIWDLFSLPGSLGDRLTLMPEPLWGWGRGEKRAVTLASLTGKKILIKMKLGTVYMVKVKHVAKYLQNLAFLYTVTKYCAGFGGFFSLPVTFHKKLHLLNTTYCGL